MRVRGVAESCPGRGGVAFRNARRSHRLPRFGSGRALPTSAECTCFRRSSVTEEAPAARNGKKKTAPVGAAAACARASRTRWLGRVAEPALGCGHAWRRTAAPRRPPRVARRSDKRRRETGLGVRATLDHAEMARRRVRTPARPLLLHIPSAPPARPRKKPIVLVLSPRAVLEPVAAAGRRLTFASRARCAPPRRRAPPPTPACTRVRARAWRERGPRHAEHRPVAPLVLLQVVLSLSSGARQCTCSWEWSSGDSRATGRV